MITLNDIWSLKDTHPELGGLALCSLNNAQVKSVVVDKIHEEILFDMKHGHKYWGGLIDDCSEFGLLLPKPMTFGDELVENCTLHLGTNGKENLKREANKLYEEWKGREKQ